MTGLKKLLMWKASGGGGGQTITVTWNNFQPPFSTELYKPYSDSNISLEDVSDGVVKLTWLKSGTLFNFATRLKEAYPDVFTTHIYYSSYMLCPSFSGSDFGLSIAGGAKFTTGSTVADTWDRASAVTEGKRNGAGLGYYPYIYDTGNYIPVAGDTCLIKAPLYVDLTVMFGAGNEPTLAEFERQCALNNIDLTASHPQDNGTERSWKI